MAKGRRHKMSKQPQPRSAADGRQEDGHGQQQQQQEKEEEAAAAANTNTAPESAEKRPAGRPRMNGESIFACQSKIYAFMSPKKPLATRPPLQEENATAGHEAKCPDKTVHEGYGKGEDRIKIGNAVEGAVTAKGRDGKESGGESPGSSSERKPEAAETRKLLPAESAVAANVKPTVKKGTKTKPGPKRKVQGKTQLNRKVTDYYPIRRSSRKSKKELQTEEKKRIDELIESGKEEGMKIDFIDGKGRGVIATRRFNRGEFVVEYHGDLLEITDARKREAMYAQDPSTGCYMYYFQYLSKTYCVDATKETNRLGRLINHSKCGNCQTKLHDIEGTPHLILVALRDIKAGEELLYDYGDRSKASIEAHPWLKH